MIVVGERIATARRIRGAKQVEFAAAMSGDYSRSAVANIETGRIQPSFARAIEAAEYLGVSLDYLAGLTDDPTPAETLSRLLADCTGKPPRRF